MSTNNENSVYVGNLAPEVDEELLQELFVQIGAVRGVRIARNKINGECLGYGFVELGSVREVEYVVRVLDGIVLMGKNLRVRACRARE